MKLKELIKEIPDIQVKGSKETEITGIASHSKGVAPGFLFIAKRGGQYDGNEYIPEALKAGASAILSDTFDPSIKNAVQLVSSSVRRSEAELAKVFWNNPSSELHMVGVTGTSGKTTTTWLIREMFQSLGSPCGLMGSVAYFIGNHQCPAHHTTPDVLTCHKLLREMIKSGARSCAMEVSSHALVQGRIEGICFDTTVFTNLSHEHLDYHVTMEAYADAKRMLFQDIKKKKEALSIVNGEDPWMERIVSDESSRRLSFALQKKADIMALEVELLPRGTLFHLSFDGKSFPVKFPLTGRFNVMNALAASAVFLGRGYPLEDVGRALEKTSAPPGRLQKVTNPLGLSIFVDYAHKVDALRKVLASLRESVKGRIITVFGCGGDRDREKRPLMGRLAEEFSDIPIVTTDNPRSEDPMKIIQEISLGFIEKRHLVIPDRREAIEKAIELALPDDIVLIAGKGHEKEQIFRHVTLPFDDYQVAMESCLKEKARRSS